MSQINSRVPSAIINASVFKKKNKVFTLFFFKCLALGYGLVVILEVSETSTVSVFGTKDPEEEGTKLLQRFGKYPVYYMD